MSSSSFVKVHQELRAVEDSVHMARVASNWTKYLCLLEYNLIRYGISRGLL